MVQAILNAREIALAFDRDVALVNASLDIQQGEVVALAGKSGSGKSTLLHCMAGLLRPDRGSVRYRGVELTELGADARAHLRLADFGFILQFGQLVPELSVAQNTAIPLRLAGQSKRAAELSAQGMLERLGVDHLGRARPGELSGGEQQRVAIARALVHGPRVVFADEPTGALDAANGEAVAQLLAEVAAERQASVIVATHDLELAKIANRVVRVEDGVTVPAMSLR